MIILAIDPGTELSALVEFNGRKVMGHRIEENAILTYRLIQIVEHAHRVAQNEIAVVCEQVESFGMPVGREVFETVRWTGHFEGRIHPTPIHWMPRRTVKLHLCGSPRAKDANIRQALLDKFGGSNAIGKKKTPGPLYGLKGHEFAALAVAVTFWETQVVTGVDQTVRAPGNTSTGSTHDF